LAGPRLAAPASTSLADFHGPLGSVVKGAILVDADSGQVLVQKDADQPWPLASVTKVMTMRVALKAIRDGKLSLDQQVLVPPEAAASNWPGSSLMFLKPGSRVKVRDLLYGMAVDSGNDACVTLAVALSGSVDAFVAEMNKEAAAMGLTTANFADPHGLSPDDRISARDMARLARLYLRDFPEALTYHSTKEFTYGADALGTPVTQPNRNRLLWDYPGADGIKTGHTEEAGNNLVATAKRGQTRLIAVVFGAPDAVGSMTGEAYRQRVATYLLDWGFTQLVAAKPLPPQGGEAVPSSMLVNKGAAGHVALTTTEGTTALVPKGLEGKVTAKPYFDRPYLVAPVTAGQPVGTLVMTLGEKELYRTTMITAEAVPRGGLFRRAWDSVRLILRMGR
jgi:D-alanyl-D-alanine carboxypeptidase (penicillin-binding protein 5/6)